MNYSIGGALEKNQVSSGPGLGLGEQEVVTLSAGPSSCLLIFRKA